MKDLFKKKTTYAVLALLLLFGFFVSQEASGETTVEASAVVAERGKVQSRLFYLSFRERWHDKYEAGLILLMDEDKRANGNRGYEFLRVSEYKNWEAGIGYTMWANRGVARTWNADETFTLMLGYRRNKWSVRLRHWSTGGTSIINGGLDTLVVGYQFGGD